MNTDWQTLYREALLELDPERAHEACERARRAINDRELELARESADAPREENWKKLSANSWFTS